MSKQKKSSAKKSPRRRRPRPPIRPERRWADSVRIVALGVITARADHALALLAHIVGRR